MSGSGGWLVAAEARSLGHGGIRAVARAAGMREATVSLGVTELEAGAGSAGPGPSARRGPQTIVATATPAWFRRCWRWSSPTSGVIRCRRCGGRRKSTRNLAAELTRQGHRVGADTVVATCCASRASACRATPRPLEGNQHPDRDAQFRYLNEQANDHQAAGQPVISVDTKKKELVGQYKNGGREWRPKGEPVRVDVHDFPDRELGKAIPYGIYDLAANTGWVNVGTDHDTAAFAVESHPPLVEQRRASPATRDADRLLITADAGGSNGYRTRAWKTELAALAAETGLTITVCHFPPGTSKWNKIEHRLFSHITMNWRGRPLTSHEVIVEHHRRDHHPHRADACTPNSTPHTYPDRRQDHRQAT